jgi:hypothetical protein
VTSSASRPPRRTGSSGGAGRAIVVVSTVEC